jgi:hypothetical protein
MPDVLTVVAKIRAAKGKGDALAALLKEQVAAVKKAEPGLLIYRPHRSSKDPDLFIFYEQYRTTPPSSCTARRRTWPPTGSGARRKA